MLVGAKNCINILALEGGPCAIRSPEVYPAIFNTSRQILIDSRRMADEAHPVHLENGIEATEIPAPTVPRGRGRPRRPQTSTKPQPVAQRINRLEGAVLDLSNVMAQFVATMTNAEDAPIPAAVRPPARKITRSATKVKTRPKWPVVIKRLDARGIQKHHQAGRGENPSVLESPSSTDSKLKTKTRWIAPGLEISATT